MKISEYHLGFVGFGHMAQVIYGAISHAKLIPQSHIYFTRRDPSKGKENEKEFGITSTTLKTLVQKSDILLLAVRPNQAEPILKQLQELEVHSKMIITVIAGIQLNYYEKYLGNNNPILRVMPNIASAITEGMSIFTYGKNSSIEFRSVTQEIFSCMGKVMELKENLTDIACAIAGSCPGFVFRLIDAVAEAGMKEGLSREQALTMAAQSFAGASRLILNGADPKDLIYQIATPKGTTEAGFDRMSETGVDKSLQSVIEASANRSRDISRTYM